MWVVKNKSHGDYVSAFVLEAGEEVEFSLERTTERRFAVLFRDRMQARLVAKLCAALDDDLGGESWRIVRMKKRAAA